MVTGTLLCGTVGLESVVTGTVLSGIVDVPLSSDNGTGELSIIQWSLLLRIHVI